MSGIAGIYNLDGQPVEWELLTRMTDSIAHRGPDGVGHWLDGYVGLGHQMLWTTPEAVHEQQPLTDETGNLCLVLDGRVDNREELIAALEARGVKLRIDTDAEIVLRSYQCWGEACPEKIIGDFAFTLWDGDQRKLFCARDILGMKPFYYYTDSRVFLFGSELRQILEHPLVHREPNEGMVGEYLASAITSKEETLFQHIFRLPSAHQLSVQPDRLRKKQYWDVDLTREIRYRTDEEYVEHFCDIFKEAVRCRLRAHGRVGAMLSGGIDSASVVGMTQSLYNNGLADDSGFETFSVVFPGLSCDEGDSIQKIAKIWAIKSNTLRLQRPDPNFYHRQVNRYLDFPDHPNGTMSDPLRELAQRRGFRVILSGWGADDWIGGGRLYYADLLRKFRVTDFIRQIRLSIKEDGFKSALKRLLHLGVFPFLPQSARQLMRLIRRQKAIPDWVDPQFAQRIGLAKRLAGQGARQRFLSFAQKDLYDWLNNGWLIFAAEAGERIEARFGLEGRHPFHDRRIVEFCFAIPQEQLRRLNQSKFLLRRMMAANFPETIRHRFTSVDFSAVFAETLQAQGDERLFDITSRQWVDEQQVCLMYDQMKQLYTQDDEGYLRYVWPLWQTFGIELWFKAVFRP